MLALRQELLQFVNDVPDDLLESFAKYIRDFKLPNINDNTAEPEVKTKEEPTLEEMINYLNAHRTNVDPKKEAAFAELEKIRKRNRHLWTGDYDREKEFLEAIDEKHGFANRH